MLAQSGQIQQFDQNEQQWWEELEERYLAEIDYYNSTGYMFDSYSLDMQSGEIPL